MKRYQIFLIFSLFVFVFNLFANSSSNVIQWKIDIEKVYGQPINRKKSSYTNSNINKLIQNGVNNKEINTSCQFQYDIDKISKEQSKLGITNSERIWVECRVGDVIVSNNAVGCSKSVYSKDPVYDANNFIYKSRGKMLGISVTCYSEKE
ncbi:hypothetical protein MRY82_06650 [bacterium]|nr:hypothetical protein [bacterium]